MPATPSRSTEITTSTQLTSPFPAWPGPPRATARADKTRPPGSVMTLLEILDSPGWVGCHPEQLASELAGDRVVELAEAGEESNRGSASSGAIDAAGSPRLRPIASAMSLKARPPRRPRAARRPAGAAPSRGGRGGRRRAVDRGPAVGAVADVGGRRPRVSGRAIRWGMNPWSPPYARSAGSGVIERTPRSASLSLVTLSPVDTRPPAPGVGRAMSRSVAIRPGLQATRPRGDGEGPIRPREDVEDRLDRRPVRSAAPSNRPCRRCRGGTPADDAVGLGRGPRSTSRSSISPGRTSRPGGGDGRRRVGTGEPGDLMARREELGDDGGPDPAGPPVTKTRMRRTSIIIRSTVSDLMR